MLKYRIAFVTGTIVGVTAMLVFLTGGDMWFITLLACSATILTTVGPSPDAPEALRENWHFALSVCVAFVVAGTAAFLLRGPLFGVASGLGKSASSAEVPIWIRLVIVGGWLVLTALRAPKAWHRSAAV
jgi:hypothetical protein